MIPTGHLESKLVFPESMNVHRGTLLFVPLSFIAFTKSVRNRCVIEVFGGVFVLSIGR